MLVSHLVHTRCAICACSPVAGVCGPSGVRLGTRVDGERAIVGRIDT